VALEGAAWKNFSEGTEPRDELCRDELCRESKAAMSCAAVGYDAMSHRAATGVVPR